jgi:hypothetical protein
LVLAGRIAWLATNKIIPQTKIRSIHFFTRSSPNSRLDHSFRTRRPCPRARRIPSFRTAVVAPSLQGGIRGVVAPPSRRQPCPGSANRPIGSVAIGVIPNPVARLWRSAVRDLLSLSPFSVAVAVPYRLM